jgi:type VI protein secretion system component Hcp
VPYFTITLTNAVVASVQRKPGQHSSQQLASEHLLTNELEEFQLSFQKIDMTWTSGGISATDDWT